MLRLVQLYPTLVEAVGWEPHGTVLRDPGEVSRVGKNGDNGPE